MAGWYVGCPGPSDAAALAACHRRQIAMTSASVARWAVISAFIDQPIASFLNPYHRRKSSAPSGMV
ncbi:hypothetical protein CHELA1G11_10005 [Hyphomicrobiales bacterium]|nr:hypothetical protein CHELA1G11_10005 [Hyphomicrobiales bacterium]CAH1677738.1 hypothetical protein CHELA1G2_14305 [Hyphomicrobiales bacterium]